MRYVKASCVWLPHLVFTALKFDRLLLLARGGRTVYFGDIGPDSSTMIDYFEKNGGSPCPKDKNPAEMVRPALGAHPPFFASC